MQGAVSEGLHEERLNLLVYRKSTSIPTTTQRKSISVDYLVELPVGSVNPKEFLQAVIV